LDERADYAIGDQPARTQGINSTSDLLLEVRLTRIVRF